MTNPSGRHRGRDGAFRYQVLRHDPAADTLDVSHVAPGLTVSLHVRPDDAQNGTFGDRLDFLARLTRIAAKVGAFTTGVADLDLPTRPGLTRWWRSRRDLACACSSRKSGRSAGAVSAIRPRSQPARPPAGRRGG